MANSGMSSHYTTILSKFLIKNLDAGSKMLPYVNRQMEVEFEGGGVTAQRPKLGDVTIGNYSEGSDMTVSAVTSTSDTITMDQQKYFNFVIDDLEQLDAQKIDLVKGYMNRADIAMAQTIDTHLLGKYASVDSGNVIGADGAGITLTKSNIYGYFMDAKKMLGEDNILEYSGGKLVAVVDVDTCNLIERSDEMIHATDAGDGVVRNGYKGRFAGFEIVESNRIATASGVKNLMLFNTELFIDFVLRVKKVKMYEPEKQFGKGVKGLAYYGSKVFHTTAGVVLKKAV